MIKQQMQQADAELARLLEEIDLTTPLASGEPRYTVLFQLINCMFCHQLPIPPRREYAA